MPWDKSATDPIKWAAEMKDFPPNAVKIFAFAIFNRVVMRTPVDTGQARQNWLISVGQEDHSFQAADVTFKKITRGKNKGKIKRKVELGSSLKDTMKAGHLGIAFSGDDKIFIQNNTPYIKMLEYGGYGKAKGQGKALIGRKFPGRGAGIKREKKLVTDAKESKITSDGFSHQAPHGMVGLVLSKADRLWERSVQAAKGNS